MALIYHGTEVDDVYYHGTKLDYVYYHGVMVYEATIYVAKPTLSGAFTFDNTAKAPTISGYDADAMTQTGTASATSAGTYTITWTLNEGYAWADGTTDPYSLTWSIAKRSVTIPSLTNTSYTWAVSSTFAPTVNNVNTSYVNQSGTVSSTNAGSWTVTWSLKYPNDTTWSDGTAANKTGSWSVAKRSMTIPSISSAKSFSFIEGTTRSITVANFNSTYETQSGTTSTSALGTYTLTWALRYPANTQWSDGTTANKTASWSIVWTNGTSYYKNDIYDKGKAVPSRFEVTSRNHMNAADITSTDTLSGGGSTYYRFILRFGTTSAANYTKMIIEGSGFSDYSSSNLYQFLRYSSSWVSSSSGGSRAASSSSFTSTKITYTLNSSVISAGASYWCVTMYGASESSKITRIHFE